MEKLIIHYGKFKDHETFCGLDNGSICIDPKAELAKEQVNCRECIRIYQDRQALKRHKVQTYNSSPITQNSLNRELNRIIGGVTNYFPFPRELGMVMNRTVISMESLLGTTHPMEYIQNIIASLTRSMAVESERYIGHPNLINYEARFDEGGSILRALLESNHYEIRMIARPAAQEPESYDDIPF